MSWDHLLVPVDWNDTGHRAVDAALELARQNQARTTLMYVIEAIDDGGDGENDLESFYAKVEADVRDRLAPVLQRFRDVGLTAEPEIIVGQKARAIVQYTATASVDLVVMASERVDLEQPVAGLGRPDRQVSLLCQCPVMLIR